MALQQQKQQVTVDEFDTFLDAHPDGLYELIHGEIVEKVVTQEHAKIAGIITGELYIYLKQHPSIQGHMGPEARYSLPDDDLNDRQPDISLHLTDEPVVKQGAVTGMPDLAVEIKSPTNSYKGQREKATYYLEHGCKMVWLIYPEKQLVEVYQPEEDIQILLRDDVISGGDLLPGFELPVADVFAG